MKKKLWCSALLAGAVVAGMLLGGCGQAKTSDTKAADAGTTSAGAAADTKAPEKTGGDENVTIRVALWDYSNTQYYKTIFDAFMEKHPNIKVEPVEFAADEYDNVITTQLSGKQDFDVVFLKNLPTTSGLINQGHLMPMDELIAADKSFDAGKYSGLLDALKVGGKTYGLPFRKDNNLLYYNKDLFDQAGVEYPKDGMTMKEFHELARKMTSGEGNDKVYGAHFHVWPGMVSNFARRIEKYNAVDPSTYEALKPYYEEAVSMQDEGLVMDFGALKTGNIHYSGVFYNQQVAMLHMGTWFINMCLENVDFNWGVCSLPNELGTGNDTAEGGVTPVSIGAYSKHPEAAWTFINYVCGEEGALVLAKTGVLPGYGSDKVNEIFDGFHSEHPNAPEGLSKYINVPKYLIETPMDPNGKAIDTVIQEEHSAIMTKSESVDEGIANLISRVKEIQAKK